MTVKNTVLCKARQLGFKCRYYHCIQSAKDSMIVSPRTGNGCAGFTQKGRVMTLFDLTNDDHGLLSSTVTSFLKFNCILIVNDRMTSYSISAIVEALKIRSKHLIKYSSLE